MSYYNNFRGTENRFWSREGSSTILHPLNDAVENLEMLPDNPWFSGIVSYPPPGNSHLVSGPLTGTSSMYAW